MRAVKRRKTFGLMQRQEGPDAVHKNNR